MNKHAPVAAAATIIIITIINELNAEALLQLGSAFCANRVHAVHRTDCIWYSIRIDVILIANANIFAQWTLQFSLRSIYIINIVNWKTAFFKCMPTKKKNKLKLKKRERVRRKKFTQILDQRWLWWSNHLYSHNNGNNLKFHEIRNISMKSESCFFPYRILISRLIYTFAEILFASFPSIPFSCCATILCNACETHF